MRADADARRPVADLVDGVVEEAAVAAHQVRYAVRAVVEARAVVLVPEVAVVWTLERRA